MAQLLAISYLQKQETRFSRLCPYTVAVLAFPDTADRTAQAMFGSHDAEEEGRGKERGNPPIKQRARETGNTVATVKCIMLASRD